MWFELRSADTDSHIYIKPSYKEWGDSITRLEVVLGLHQTTTHHIHGSIETANEGAIGKLGSGINSTAVASFECGSGATTQMILSASDDIRLEAGYNYLTVLQYGNETVTFANANHSCKFLM